MLAKEPQLVCELFFHKANGSEKKFEVSKEKPALITRAGFSTVCFFTGPFGCGQVN